MIYDYAGIISIRNHIEIVLNHVADIDYYWLWNLKKYY